MSASEDSNIAKRWRELSGEKHWEGILKPIDKDLKNYLLHYGELTQATYDTFITEKASKFAGGSRFPPEKLMNGIGLQSRHKPLMKYKVTKYLYATSSIDFPGFMTKSTSATAWTRTSNWMGYVAVVKDEGKAYLGRRDIVVAWRGTIMAQEWSKDFDATKTKANKVFNSDVKIHTGFLSVYTSTNPTSKYNKTSARDQALEEVKKLIGEHKGEDMSITVVGHSLGGALAHLFSADLVANGINKGDKPIPVTAFPWASPRVGDSSFKQLVDSLGAASNSPKFEDLVKAETGKDLRILRIVNSPDMVPRGPPSSVGGFTHVGQVYLLNAAKLPSLANPMKIAIAHDMESSYLHGVSKSRGSGMLQMTDQGGSGGDQGGGQGGSGGRDIALVNKYQDALKKSFHIPAKWWTAENKGMQQGKNGDWKNKLGDWIEKYKGKSDDEDDGDDQSDQSDQDES